MDTNINTYFPKKFENLLYSFDARGGTYSNQLFSKPRILEKQFCASPFIIGDILKRMQAYLQQVIKNTNQSPECFQLPQFGDIELDSNHSWRILLKEIDAESLTHAFYQTTDEEKINHLRTLVANYHSRYPAKDHVRSIFAVYCTNEIAQFIFLQLLDFFKSSFPTAEWHTHYEMRELKKGIELEFYFDNGAVCFQFLHPRHYRSVPDKQMNLHIDFNRPGNQRKVYIKIRGNPDEVINAKLIPNYIPQRTVQNQNHKDIQVHSHVLKNHFNMDSASGTKEVPESNGKINETTTKNIENQIKQLLKLDNNSKVEERFSSIEEVKSIEEKKQNNMLDMSELPITFPSKVLTHSSDSKNLENETFDFITNEEIDQLIKDCELEFFSEEDYQKILEEVEQDLNK